MRKVEGRERGQKSKKGKEEKRREEKRGQRCCKGTVSESECSNREVKKMS